MMFRLLCLPVAPALVLGTAISVQAQWMPVVAKQIEIVYWTDENGSEVVRERRGTFHRSSTGSVMRKWTPIVNGEEMGSGSAFFVDASSGSYYLIHHAARSAHLVQQRTAPLLPKERNLAPEDIVGEKVVNGVACVGLRVSVNGQPTDGVDWVSISYDLHVKKEFTLPSGQRVVKELYDIKFTDPPPSKMGFPSDYTIDQSECRGCDNSPAN